MSSMLLQVDGLTLATDEGVIIDQFSLGITRGEIVALTGKSGIGKTSIGLAILGMLPTGIRLMEGTIKWLGTPGTEKIYPRDSAVWPSLRASQIGYIQQDVFGIFDPVLRMGHQMSMIVRECTEDGTLDVEGELRLKMAEVGVTEIDRVWRSFPHQLSGGQLQRCQICLSIVIQPSLLIADEPTSAIDKINQVELLDLFAHIRHQYNMAILFITHEEAVVKYLADRQIEMSGTAKNARDRGLLTAESNLKAKPILEVVNLGFTHRFGGVFNQKGAKLRDLNFTLHESQCLGIIGESGSGKSTLAQLLVGLINPSEGQVKLHGDEINFMKRDDIRFLRSKIQLVMQDGRGSLHPNISVRRLLQAVVDQRRKKDRNLNIDLRKVMEQVGLSPNALDRNGQSLSGGECLRISIARALLMQPEILICDESTTSLDGPTKDEIIELLISLMNQQRLALILISHDDSIIRRIAHDILVLAGGQVVEMGKAEIVINHPTHPVTRKIFEAQATLSQKRSP